MHELIISCVIPSTQQSYKTIKKDGVDVHTRTEESKSVRDFKDLVGKILDADKPADVFPTSKQIFISIIQFYVSTKKDYNNRDVDNMAKTMLDVLEKRFYNNDSQVRTLLVSKRVDVKRVQENLAYIYIKILEDNQDTKLVHRSVKRAESLYLSLKEGRISIRG